MHDEGADARRDHRGRDRRVAADGRRSHDLLAPGPAPGHGASSQWCRSARLRLAPVLDAVCIVAFVALGRDRHGIDGGIGWFATVLWPLLVGWFAAALLTRLYGRAARSWNSLVLTLMGGLAIASLCRALFTHRPLAGVFTLVALGFLGLTTAGWRAGVGAIARRRARASPGGARRP